MFFILLGSIPAVLMLAYGLWRGKERHGDYRGWWAVFAVAVFLLLTVLPASIMSLVTSNEARVLEATYERSWPIIRQQIEGGSTVGIAGWEADTITAYNRDLAIHRKWQDSWAFGLFFVNTDAQFIELP